MSNLDTSSAQAMLPAPLRRRGRWTAWLTLAAAAAVAGLAWPFLGRFLADQLPIVLQDHRNPTAFRNIWARPLDAWAAAK